MAKSERFFLTPLSVLLVKRYFLIFPIVQTHKILRKFIFWTVFFCTIGKMKFLNHVAPNQVKDATDEDFKNIFQRAVFFQTLLKHFLEVARSWSRYLKDALDSALCNRKKIRNVRHTNPILSTEMSDSCVFFNIQNLASKSDSKILWKSSFFARKFFFERL